MSDFMPRVTGTEWETAIMLQQANDDWSRADGSALSTVLSHHLPKYIDRFTASPSMSDYFLGNGARVYVDHGEHIEYATPEDTTFRGTNANEIAGEHILAAALDSYVDATDNLQGYSLNKRLIDNTDTPRTWGRHENYFLHYAKNFPQHAKLLPLLAHVSTRPLYGGAGYAASDGAYYLSQKMIDIKTDISTSTISDKPLVNTRNEPHTGNNERGIRMHLTSGDAPLLPWANFMTLATTSMVLRLVETNADFDSEKVTPSNNTFFLMAKKFNADPTLATIQRMKDGQYRTALDIQDILHGSIVTMRKAYGKLPREEEAALDDWGDALHALKHNPPEMFGKIDWLTKYHIMLRAARKRDLSLADSDIRQYDMAWGVVGEKGIAVKLRSKYAPSWYDESLAIERRTVPPRTTRALPRGLFVTLLAACDLPAMAAVNWSRVALGTSEVKLSHPLNQHTKPVEDVFAPLFG